MAATHIEPYLFFGGRCEEAIAFYGQALGATVEILMRFADCPEPIPPDKLPEGGPQKIMHVTLRIGEAVLMASDGDRPRDGFSGFRLSLSLPAEADARRAFDALAEGGSVQMPIGPTFWSPCFGMVTDRFGVGWMVTVDEPAGG